MLQKYFDILGIKNNASEDDIKKAYTSSHRMSVMVIVILSREKIQKIIIIIKPSYIF